MDVMKQPRDFLTTHRMSRKTCMATYDNAQFLALCGERNPYDGRLGVIAPGSTLRLITEDACIFKDTRS